MRVVVREKREGSATDDLLKGKEIHTEVVEEKKPSTSKKSSEDKPSDEEK